MVQIRRSQVDLNATDELGRRIYSMNGTPLSYEPTLDFGTEWLGGAFKEMGQVAGQVLPDIFGRVVPELAGMAYDRAGNIIGDATNTLLAGQPYSPSPRTALSMPLDSYNYDEDISVPPEYNNAVPTVRNYNREVSVRPYVQNAFDDVSNFWNGIVGDPVQSVAPSGKAEVSVSLPSTANVDPEQGMVDAFNNTGTPGAYTIQSDREVGEAWGYGSQGPVDNPFVQEVGPHSLPPGIRYGEGLVTSVPLADPVEPYNFNNNVSYPDRVANPEIGGLMGGNFADNARGFVIGSPANAALKVAEDESLTDGQRAGAAVTSGAMGVASALGGPAAGLVGLLGGIFNSLGYHQDTDEVTGNISLSKGGTLSGDTKGIFYDGSYEPGGSSFYQTGSLNNYNFFDALASTQPDQVASYKGFETTSAGARNLAGLDHYFGGDYTADAVAAGDATGGWGNYDDPGMSYDNSGLGM